ncbi:hypothetical protein AB0H23_32710 [Streptomyces albogriseolus]|uniref:hypothetical protein n=1 Tax=Streptomyces albogriseolus TaxID=1887 RepID=UPI0034609CB0
MHERCDHTAPTGHRPLPAEDTIVTAHQADGPQKRDEPPQSTTVRDVIRVATRAYSNGSVRGRRTYLHINCPCRIGPSTLKGTYPTMDEARRAANELIEGTGDYVRTCSNSGIVKAQALARPVRHFDSTLQAYGSAFNGAGARDGDVIVVTSEGVVAIVIRTAVLAITTERGNLMSLTTSALTYRDGLYAEIVDRAEAEARRIGANVNPLHAAPAVEEAPAPADQVASMPEQAPTEDVRTRFAPGEQVRVTPMSYDTFHEVFIPAPDFIATVVGYTRNGSYRVREPDHNTTCDYDANTELHKLADPPAESTAPAEVVRTDGVTVEADGRGTWRVLRGSDRLGTIFDQGLKSKRGRFAGWSLYAGTRGNVTVFADDPAEVVESIVQEWPVTAADIAAETGAPLHVVLAAVDTVREEDDRAGRQGVLRNATTTGPAQKLTRDAAARVREALAQRPARYSVPVGTDDRAFPRFHDRAAAVRCATEYGIPETAITDAEAPAELPGPE